MASVSGQPAPSVPFLVGLSNPMDVSWYVFLGNLFKAVGSGVSATEFAPTDQSGLNLLFPNASIQYTTFGNFVSVYGQLTYPPTISGVPAAISLPIPVPNQPYAAVVGTAIVGGVAGFAIATVPGTATARILGTSGALTNATLSGGVVNFFLTYPVS